VTDRRVFPLRNPTAFQDVISGRRGGWAAAVVRGCLRLVEIPYTWAVEYRNRRYDRGQTPIRRVSVPVISVGNITAGGTGKTPLVAWLADTLLARGLKVVLISRGYKAQTQRPNDEALELRQRLPNVPHLQDPDRVAAAQAAIRELGCDVIVLDDAFQHRRIHRDLDIVLIDALQPFGFRHVLPRGLLREPLARLARADVVGLSRADAVDAAQRAALREEISKLAPRAAWMELAHRPQMLINADGSSRNVADLAGRRVAAFCGIGNPDAFRCSLAGLGYRIAAFHRFPDHHLFSRQDIAALERSLVEQPALDAVVCTCKDLVKLDISQIGSLPLWALAISIDVTDGLPLLEVELDRVLAVKTEQ
jgi:tetraacyldisaccharide 4'-kinase